MIFLESRVGKINEVQQISRTKKALVKIQMCLKLGVSQNAWNCRLIFPKKDILNNFDGQSRIRVSFLGPRGSVGQKVSTQDFAGLQDVSDPRTAIVTATVASSADSASSDLWNCLSLMGPLSEGAISSTLGVACCRKLSPVATWGSL